MTAIITTKYRVELAKLLKADLDGASITKNYYLFIGKSKPWDVDTLPPAPTDTTEIEFRVWDDMLALKRVVDTEASHVVPRFDWDTTGNTIYVPYGDEDADLYNHPTTAEKNAAALAGTYTAGSFYVVTDQLHVFKCLDNNGGAKSTTKPQKPLSSPYVFSGADGYRWKYMYTVNATEFSKFMTDTWLPVKTLAADDGSDQWLVQADASTSAGEISQIQVTAGGSGYTNVIDADPANPVTTLAISGTTNTIVFPAGASASNNAYNNCTAWIVAGTGVGQSRKILSYVGSTKTATVASNWVTIPDATSQIKVLPSVDIVGNGSGASAQPTVVGGIIKTIKMITRGSNYTYALASISSGNGSGAVVAPSLPPKGGHGSDAIVELGGRYLCMSTKLQYAEGSGDFPIVNDYRRVGLIKNVKTSGGSIATASTLRAAPTISITSATGTFLPDENIVGSISGAVGSLVQIDPNVGASRVLTYFQDTTTGFTAFQTSDVVTGQTSGATGVVSAAPASEAQKNSGNLMYVEHRRPIMRASDQTEIILLVLKM